MGRFALQYEDQDKDRDKGRKSFVGAAMSFVRLLVTTTLLAYLIVLCWMWMTGDTTLWRVIQFLR